MRRRKGGSEKWEEERLGAERGRRMKSEKEKSSEWRGGRGREMRRGKVGSGQGEEEEK